MNRTENLKKLAKKFDKYDCDIYEFCYYIGINNVIEYDDKISDSDINKIVDICDLVCKDREDPIEVGQDVAISIFEDKDISLELLRRLPTLTIAKAYREGNLEDLNIKKEKER